MPKASDMFPSKYLKAGDIGNKIVRATIECVQEEEVGQQREQKWVLYFKGKTKGLVLNKTNTEALAMGLGEDTDDWTGATVDIYTEMTMYQGERKPGTRVRAVEPRQQEMTPDQPSPTDPVETPSNPFGDNAPPPPSDTDDIPF